jgi:hypothetical protein
MATIAESAFTPTARAQMAAEPTSSNVALPTTGTPTLLRVTNLGPFDAFVLLGSSSAVAAAVATGLTVLARTSSPFLVIGSNTYLAAITQSGGAALNLDLGN